MKLDRSLIHIYTGNGKGKTTAAFGLALRASGAGLKVFMLQFMKGRRYSEIDGAAQIPALTIEQHGRDEFVSKKNPSKIDLNLAEKGLARAREMIGGGKYDIVILDEINVALDFALVNLNDVVEIITGRPSHVEIVCTGRYAPKGLIDIADLVTEMNEIKHPYQKGFEARKGIDW